MIQITEVIYQLLDVVKYSIAIVGLILAILCLSGVLYASMILLMNLEEEEKEQ